MIADTAIPHGTILEAQPSAPRLPADAAVEVPETRCASSPIPHSALCTLHSPESLSPIADIPAYLSTRSPVPHFTGELALWLRVPQPLKNEIIALLGASPDDPSLFRSIQRRLNAGLSLQKAIAQTLSVLSVASSSNPKTIRAKFDAWSKSRDWLTLLNRTKAGAAWQDRGELAARKGLPDVFLEKVCAAYFGRFKRADGKRQALFAIYRWWRTGRNLDGLSLPMPGYETGWAARNPNLRPPGWDYSNILRQIKARQKFTPVHRALLHESAAAARELLPQVLSTRAGLRFLERLTFDDVRTDWLIFDPETGQPCELWLLVARDTATAMVLGFVMHPGVAMDVANRDPRAALAKRQHLGHQEMKQLAAWLLERYPLPLDYLSHWVVERGTATLTEGSARALAELLSTLPCGARIQVHYTAMHGGKSPAGFKEKAKGNSRGKASHESHNRLFHTQSSYLPGQTGASYDLRPADLNARAAECIETWELRQRLPEHLRGREQYSLLLPSQAREHLVQFCLAQNFRQQHALEDFADVLEWYNPLAAQWQPQNTYVPSVPSVPSVPLVPSVQFRRRKEMPVERAVKLMSGCRWAKASPDAIIAFLQHTSRTVKPEPSGEIKFRQGDQLLTFSPPPDHASRLTRNASLLAYHSPDDPAFLHVTDGQGGILGTWYRRTRVPHGDEAALQLAIKHTANALKAAQAYAGQLAAPEREALAALRQSNADLGAEFIQIADAPKSDTAIPTLSSPIASALTTGVENSRAAHRAALQAAAQEEDRARATLRKAANMF